MDELIWVLVLTGMAMLTMRWLLAWGASPISHDGVRRLFLQRLTAVSSGVVITAETKDHVTLTIQEQPCTVVLTQLARRCLEQPAQTHLFIRQAVSGLLHAVHAVEALPTDWDRRVLPLLLPSDAVLPPDLVARSFTTEVQVAYALDYEHAIRWLTWSDLAEIGLNEERLHEVALRNLERSCNVLVIDALPQDEEGSDRLLRFRTQDGLDAARLQLPSFYQRFSPRFGDVDLLVAVPSRDTLIMIGADDQQQMSVLSWHARGLYNRAAYPLYGGLFKVTEHGLERWHHAGSAVG